MSLSLRLCVCVCVCAPMHTTTHPYTQTYTQTHTYLSVCTTLYLSLLSVAMAHLYMSVSLRQTTDTVTGVGDSACLASGLQHRSTSGVSVNAQFAVYTSKTSKCVGVIAVAMSYVQNSRSWCKHRPIVLFLTLTETLLRPKLNKVKSFSTGTSMCG